MNTQAAQQLSGTAAVAAASRRAANLELVAYPWLNGNTHGAGCMFANADAISTTSKHRLRRPPDSSH